MGLVLRVLMTLSEVAELVSVPEQVLLRWRAVGVGPPSYLISGRVLYVIDDVLAWQNRDAEVVDEPSTPEVSMTGVDDDRA